MSTQEPGAMSEVTGNQEDVGLEGGEGVLPEVEAAGPFGDVHVGEVEDDQTVEGGGEALAGEFEEVDVGLIEHGGNGRRSVLSGQEYLDEYSEVRGGCG